MELDGKIAVVTGGTDGIGREIASQLAALGANVVVVGRTAKDMYKSVSGIHGAIAVDLSTAAGCDELVSELADRQIDILVNNAGNDPAFVVGRPIDVDALDRAMYLNLQAPIRIIAGLLPGLLQRPSAAIVNVTSGLAIAGSASTPVYCAAKAGLRHFTLALRGQLRGTSVTLIEALPPMVDTAMTRAIDQRGKISPAVCAAAIVSAIRSDSNEANIGQVRLLRAIYSISPAFARRLMLHS